MNFLLRPSQNAAVAAADHLPPKSKTPPTTTLQGLIAADKSTSVDYSLIEDHTGKQDDGNDTTWMTANSNNNNNTNDFAAEKHIDVMEDEGCIIIPIKELPVGWKAAPNMQWLRSFDRSFVFPGEQVHIVACLSAFKQDSEIITPFKVAAVMNKNGSGEGVKNQSEITSHKESSYEQVGRGGQVVDVKSESGHQDDVSASESFLRMEDHRRQTQTVLQRFEDSHFFVRIAESGEQLWSKMSKTKAYEEVGDVDRMKEETAGLETSICAVIDSGRFDALVAGGVVRNSVECSSLVNGDIVVLLQVNVAADSLNDPILEIFQFEKHRDRITAVETDVSSAEHNPCGELLKWLLPLSNSHLPMNRSLSPPLVNASNKTSFSASSGSQLFSFGNFRSNSMSALPQNVAPVASSLVSVASSKPNFDVEDWDNFASQKFVKSLKTGSQNLLSFRGVSLEPERFSVCCGLEGIYIPGRRWRKRLEIIQPVDIHTFSADCNTEDLLCVQIKNVSPAHIPDMIVYVDAITIVLEEASKIGPAPSVPISCIEAGTDHSLPNLALRKGEEHSFILKPATSFLKRSTTTHGAKINKSHFRDGSRTANTGVPLKAVDGRRNLCSDKYAVLVSCRCNYSESRLFFKKPTDWKPRISRDLLISVASEISQQTVDLIGKVSQLSIQMLTLQASNLTTEDLNMTVLAPASFTAPPSVLSLNSAPSTPMTPFVRFTTTQGLSSVPHFAENQKQNSAQSLPIVEPTVAVADVIPATALTHLWLQSRVPLGCVPSQSTATIKLELLPLTDGIITLDTLQIYVKEKGRTYVPEHVLKINATSSIATGIF